MEKGEDGMRRKREKEKKDSGMDEMRVEQINIFLKIHFCYNYVG